MRAEIVKLADDNLKLRQDFQRERNRKRVLAEQDNKDMNIKLIKQAALLEGIQEQFKHYQENAETEK